MTTTTTNTANRSRKFSVMWSNNLTNTRPMSEFRVTLRDAIGETVQQGTHGGITCDQLHLDQVHIQFRPTGDITADEFIAGDSSTLHWRPETMELYVQTTPGVRHSMFTQAVQNADGVSDGTLVQPHRSLQYSSAMFLTGYAGNEAEDYWLRTYRPLRDLPVAYELRTVSELTIELLWPLLQGDSRVAANRIPDYRIWKVVCDFSMR